MQWPKKKHKIALDQAIAEREAVRSEGEQQRPVVRRLRRRLTDNHFIDLLYAALEKEKPHGQGN